MTVMVCLLPSLCFRLSEETLLSSDLGLLWVDELLYETVFLYRSDSLWTKVVLWSCVFVGGYDVSPMQMLECRVLCY